MNGAFVVAAADAKGAATVPPATMDHKPAATAAAAPLPRTGPFANRVLLLLAGLALAAGGLSVLGGARIPARI